MKRIYFTAVPLADNFLLDTKPVKTIGWRLETGLSQCAFPIVPIIDATAAPGDEVIVVAVNQRSVSENANRDTLARELHAIGRSRLTIRDVVIPEEATDDAIVDLFKSLIVACEPEACYYACMTFGTKLFPIALFSALSYAEKALKDAEVHGIYYQELHREAGEMTDAIIRDVTRLFYLNRIVDTTAAMDGADTQKVVDLLLNW